MLLWQQSEHEWSSDWYYEQSHDEIRKKAIVSSLVLYLFFCMPLFIGSTKKKEVIIVNTSLQPVLFVASKKTNRSGGSKSTEKGSLSKQSNQSTVAPVLPKKELLKKPEKPVKQVKKKEAPKPVKKPKKAEVRAPQTKESVLKKPEPKKTPKSQPPKIAEKIKEIPKKEPEKQPYEPEPVVLKNEIKPSEQANKTEIIDCDISDVSENVSKAHRALSHALARVWKAPQVVVQKTLKLLVDLTDKGLVNEVIIEESSGVIVYDISARAAALRAQYPQEFWGKKIAIVFSHGEA